MIALRRTLLALLILLALPVAAQAQALFCNVNVNYQSLTGTDYTYLNDLQLSIREYFNQGNWTEDEFEQDEAIDCDVQVVMTEAVTLTQFRARIIVSARRPIYGSGALTRTFQISDDAWSFDYAQNTPLIRQPERYHPLTSVLDFYAFLILGYDYDTFSELGGTPYFDEARRIAERAQALNAPGWSALGSDRNRSELIQQILEPQYQPIRKAYYTYHYDGLDHFIAKPREARQAVLTALEELQEMLLQTQREYVMDIFLTAKNEELAAIFTDSPFSSQAYAILADMDPSNISTYDRIVN
ncbi:MAG: DUF4835 family protein [Rhodothermales bacterium]